MRNKVLFYALGLGAATLLSGCVVRTYPLTKDRVDQDLSTASGNRGYIQGTAPAAGERKPTRTTQVVEFELQSPFQFKKCPKAPAYEPAAASMEEPMSVDTGISAGIEEAPETGFEKYTVQKGDTLQKISQKFFGTTKKWMKIYEANSDTLKGPNKIYVGQSLNIPMDPSMKPSGKIK